MFVCFGLIRQREVRPAGPQPLSKYLMDFFPLRCVFINSLINKHINEVFTRTVHLELV